MLGRERRFGAGTQIADSELIRDGSRAHISQQRVGNAEEFWPWLWSHSTLTRYEYDI